MSEHVFTPVSPFPPLSEADVRRAASLLRHRVAHVDAHPDITLNELDQHSLSFMQHQETDDIAKAIGLYGLLASAVGNPQVAARLPEGPYPGPGSSQPWHAPAAGLLPAAVLLAGDDTVLAALRGHCDPATLSDPTLERVEHAQMAAVVAVKEWRDRSFTKKKDADRAVDTAFTAFEVWADDRWPGYNIDEAWRTNLDHDPFLGARMKTSEVVAFGRFSCPLSYTSRYPSAPKDAESKWAGSNTKRGMQVQMHRSLWIGCVEGLVESLHGWLIQDLLAVPPLSDGKTPLFKAPTQRLSETPVRMVAVSLTTGRGWGKPKSKGRVLPVPGTTYPTGTAAEQMVEVRTKTTGPDVSVTIPLPVTALPSMEETAVAIVRILAHELLTHVPDLTPHAQQVLAAWRDAGPEPWGPRPVTTLADLVDAAVAHVTSLGVEWEQPLPERVTRLI